MTDAWIETLQSEYIIRTPRIREAFLAVPRRKFLPPTSRNRSGENIPLPIGHGQTISQPLTVAIMLELLQPKPGERVLDIGAGSGWVSALLAQLVGPHGRVTAIERIPHLAQLAKANVASMGYQHVEVMTGDAFDGWPAAAPYDVIHVAAAADTEPPSWRQQLRLGGRLILPVGPVVQDLALITKTGENSYTEQRVSGFQFVPLITKMHE